MYSLIVSGLLAVALLLLMRDQYAWMGLPILGAIVVAWFWPIGGDA